MGKYNYDKIPALKYLKMDKIKGTPFISDNDSHSLKESCAMEHFFDNNWSKFYTDFSKNIVVASDTFQHNIVRSEKQLKKIYLNMMTLKSTIPQSSISLVNKSNETILFFSHYSNHNEYYCIFYLFSWTGKPILLYDIKMDDEKYYANQWMSDYFKNRPQFMGIKDGNYSVVQMVGTMILLFQKYAKVETKVFPAKTKTRTFHGKYMNETDFDIIHLDSTWFTNLVQSNAFNVRGHFRLQPKKANGEWTKELIWIDDFQKNGYTRKAQMLRTENEYLVSKESILA